MAIAIGSVVLYHIETSPVKDRPGLVLSINGDTSVNLIVFENPDLDQVDDSGNLTGNQVSPVQMGMQRSVLPGSTIGTYTQVSSF
jgi:hypothetical protein